MKVLCISNTADRHPDAIGDFLPKEGSTYTVKETVSWYGMEWYILEEDVSGNGWNPRYFIPIQSNKFDTELQAILKVPKFKKLHHT